MKASQLREIIRELIQNHIDEMSTTGALVQPGGQQIATTKAFTSMRDWKKVNKNRKWEESVNEAKETFYFDDILDILNGSSFSQEIKPTDPKVKELLQKKYKNIVDFARTVASTYDIKPSSTLNPTPDTQPKSFLVTRAFNFMSKEFGSDRFNQPNYKNITPGEYKLIKSRRGKHTYLNPNNVKITLSDSDMATLTRPENDLVTNIVKESVNESYRRFKKKVTNPRQQMNNSVREIEKHLREVDRIVEYNLKLKTEMDVGGGTFYEGTNKRLARISERMNQLNNKLKELGN